MLKVIVRLIGFLSSTNLICRSTDISKCFIESLGVRDNESWLYSENCEMKGYTLFGGAGAGCIQNFAVLKPNFPFVYYFLQPFTA